MQPIIIYCCETWTMTRANEVKLRCFERKVLRKIFGPRHNPNTNQYRMRWFGHVHRMNDERLAKLVWEDVPTGKRPPGRLRMRWNDNIRADLAATNVLLDQNLIEDRRTWKQVVQSAWPTRGCRATWWWWNHTNFRDTGHKANGTVLLLTNFTN